MSTADALPRSESGSTDAVKAVSIIRTGTVEIHPEHPFGTESLDVMGDGSLVLLPTPGHTEGSISLLIRRGTRPPLLLVGDLTYGAELLERRQVPGVGNRRRLAETTGKVLALKRQMPGPVILPAHDPTAAARLLGT